MLGCRVRLRIRMSVRVRVSLGSGAMVRCRKLAYLFAVRANAEYHYAIKTGLLRSLSVNKNLQYG